VGRAALRRGRHARWARESARSPPTFSGWPPSQANVHLLECVATGVRGVRVRGGREGRGKRVAEGQRRDSGGCGGGRAGRRAAAGLLLGCCWTTAAAAARRPHHRCPAVRRAQERARASARGSRAQHTEHWHLALCTHGTRRAVEQRPSSSGLELLEAHLHRCRDAGCRHPLAASARLPAGRCSLDGRQPAGRLVLALLALLLARCWAVPRADGRASQCPRTHDARPAWGHRSTATRPRAHTRPHARTPARAPLPPTCPSPPQSPPALGPLPPKTS
jgi:hypothetical protein